MKKILITGSSGFLGDQPRNLTMDCTLAQTYGIHFPDSI